MTGMLIFLKGMGTLAKSVPWQMWAIIAIVLAFVLYGWYSRSEGEQIGREAVTKELTNADRKNESAADAASNRVTRCYGTGGQWNTSRGVCDYPGGR